MWLADAPFVYAQFILIKILVYIYGINILLLLLLLGSRCIPHIEGQAEGSVKTLRCPLTANILLLISDKYFYFLIIDQGQQRLEFYYRNNCNSCISQLYHYLFFIVATCDEKFVSKNNQRKKPAHSHWQASSKTKLNKKSHS